MSKIIWTKEGGHDKSRVIVYTASVGGYTILRTCNRGRWTLPAVYQYDRFVRGCASVSEAKDFVKTMMPAGKPLIEPLIEIL